MNAVSVAKRIALLTILGSAIGLAIAACGSDEDAPGVAGEPDGAVVDPSKDAGGGGDSEVGDACAMAEAGIGKTCATSKDCPCDTVCAALRCVRRSSCDEALLTWTGATENSDGTCLTDVKGYTIRWGSLEAGTYDFVLDAGLPCLSKGKVACGVDAGDAGKAGTIDQLECAWRLQHLEAGSWAFTVSTFNEAGVESVPSVSASKKISCP